MVIRKYFSDPNRNNRNLKDTNMSVGSNFSYISDDLWNNALAKPTSKGKPKKSDIIKHPLFLTASELIGDDYWKMLFDKMAKGKFPKGFAYQDGYLLHRASGINTQLPDNVSSLIEVVVLFLRQKGRIYSPNDLTILETIANQSQQEQDGKSNWEKIYKSKEARAVYIRDYVQRQDLPSSVKDEYFTQVNVLLDLGVLNKNNILFESGAIQAISGVSIIENKVVSDFLVGGLSNKIKMAKSSVISDKKVSYHEDWMSKLRDMVGRVSNNNHSSTVVLTSESINT